MMRQRAGILLYITLVLLVLLTASAVVCAETEIGKVTFAEGRVDVLRGGNLPSKPLQVNDPIFEKDTVRTKSMSKAEITFKDGNVLRLAQSTRIDISEYISNNDQNKSTVKLPRGHVRAIVDKSIARRIADSPSINRFEVHTPNVVAGVRGSDGDLMFDPITGDTIITIREGIFYVFNLLFPDKLIDIGTGNTVTVPQNAPPGQPRPVTNAESMKNEKSTDPGKKDTSQSDSKGSTASSSSVSSLSTAADSTAKNISNASAAISADTNVYQPPITQYVTATPSPAPTPTPAPAATPAPTASPAKTYNFGGTITDSTFGKYDGSTNTFSKGGSITGSMAAGTYSGAYTPFSFTASGAFSQPDGYPLWAYALSTSSTNSYITMSGVAGGASGSGAFVGTYKNSYDNTEGFVVSYGDYLTATGFGGSAGAWNMTGQLVTVPINPIHGNYGYGGYYYGFNNITSQTDRVDYSNDKYFKISSWGSNGAVYGTSYGVTAVDNVPYISVGTAIGYYNNNVLQLTDIYKYMAASQYLYLACGNETGVSGCSTTTPVASLAYLNMPSVEIGRTNLSGALISGADYVSLNMSNVVFFAPSTGQKPSIFAIGSITGSYSPGTSLTSAVLLSQAGQIYLSDYSKAGLNMYFNFGMWSAGKWNATIGPSFTSGAVSGGTLTGSSWSGSVILNGWAGGTLAA